jgi:hypothetical protein
MANEYTKALEKALTDLEDKVRQRDFLTAKIAGLKETVRVLSSRTQLPPAQQTKVARLIALADAATPRLTDSIRSLLGRAFPRYVTAIEVRNELEDSSDEYGLSLSACHAALKRMLKDGEVEKGPPGTGGKTTYRLVFKVVCRPMNRLSSLASVAKQPIDPDKLPPEVREMIHGKARRRLSELK